VRGLSIGFKPLKAQAIKGTYGVHVLEWLWAELSAVTIPQNVEATILTIKSADQAAMGRRSPLPGVTGATGGRPRKDASVMTISEQVTQWSNARAPKAAKIAELMAVSAAAGATLDEAQAEEFDSLEREVKSIDQQLTRLKTAEALQVASAVPITAKSAAEASAQRGGLPVISVRPNVPPGTGFIRYCQALAVGRGSRSEAAEFAKQWKDSTPEIELVLKAAVAAGTTTDATWAGPLAPMRPLVNEFLAMLRPKTLIGNIPGLRQVPFNISVPSQTGGGTYGWVGQGAPKPVGKLAFGTVTLAINKVAGIIAITEELARTSSPPAEDLIRQDMVAGIAAFLNTEFVDPAKAAVANVSPGSITNGVTPITSAGTTPANARTDIQALLNALAAAGLPVSQAVLLMSEANALALGFGLNPLGQPLFPSLGPSGGNALGIPVVTSQSMGSWVVALEPSSILLADDGGVTIDVSREASVQMDTAPMNPADATVVMTSFWQNNLVGLRAERFITWKKARTGCVQFTVATYVA
jgi:HK97 family phage major capsid protein